MNRLPNSWDLPVIQALDAIEQLPGFAPSDVRWDAFRFFGPGTRDAVNTVLILAYTPTPEPGRDEGRVIFRFRDGRFALRGPTRNPISIEQASRTLRTPLQSTWQAALLLRDALPAALEEFKQAHKPLRLSPPRVPAHSPTDDRGRSL